MRRNNILNTMMQQLKAGVNPGAMLDQMAQNDPGVAQAMGMIRGKTPEQLRTMAHNMARESGTSVEQVARSLGLKLPK